MLQINSMQEFQAYLGAVEGRIDHHAGKVKSTTLILAGIVAARAKPGTVQVRTYAGATKNVIWFEADGGQFCLAYNHDSEGVEVRKGSLQGKVLLDLNDDNFSDDVHGWIEELNEIFTGVQNAKAA